MRHVKRCTIIRYPLLTYVIATFCIHTSLLVPSMHMARQRTVSPPLFWPGAPSPDVCSGASVMRALHWDQVCPGSKQRIHFSFTLSRAEGVSCVGAGWVLLLLSWLFLFAVSLPLLGLPLFLCLRLPARPPCLKIEPGPRSCPLTREGVSAAVGLCFRSPLK